MAEDSSQKGGQEIRVDEIIENAEQRKNVQDGVGGEWEGDVSDVFEEVEASFFIVDVDKDDKRGDADFFPSLSDLGRPTMHALDIGSGDLLDPRTTRSVDPRTGRRVYIGITSKRGNIKIHKVTPNNFIFGTKESTPRYITARQRGSRWQPLWMAGSDPGKVTASNMSSDQRVWEVFYKSSNYYIRLEMDNRLYLKADRGRLGILRVSDPNNTRDVTPLSVRPA